VKGSAVYATATAFRQALEAHLMTMARADNVDVQRLRRQVAFDRLLSRLFRDPAAPWALKGGYAMELRLAAARATRDIDLTVQAAAGRPRMTKPALLAMLQAAAAHDLGDFFTFLVGEPVMDLDAAPYGGARFPVEARMDGRVFARFHLDAGVGDAIMGSADTVCGRDWLAFAGIRSAEFQAISREQQFAEKYHAYTLPRGSRPNSRVRDLLDMALLIGEGRLDPRRTAQALRATYAHRETHPFAADMPQPPQNWERPFAALAAECGWAGDMATAHASVHKFINALPKRNR
jgi:hypothetical protein